MVGIDDFDCIVIAGQFDLHGQTCSQLALAMAERTGESPARGGTPVRPAACSLDRPGFVKMSCSPLEHAPASLAPAIPAPGVRRSFQL